MSDQEDRLSKEEHKRIFREIVLPEAELDQYTPQERPRAVILAGQPGAGKGSLRTAVESEFKDDIFAVDPDEQREFHSEAKRWQQEYPYGWSQKTNTDAGAWAGELRDAGIERRVNVLIDTTLSDARQATRLIEGLQKAGYEVEVRAVGAHELESRVGIDRRFTSKVETEGVGRDVPLAFHDKVYADLPDNLDKVAANTGVRVRIYDRDDPANAVFDSQRDVGPPSAALRETRDGRLQDPETTQRMRSHAQQQADWHRDPQDRLLQSERFTMSPDTLDALRRERSEANKPAISARDSEAWSTLDEVVREGAPPARAPIPSFELPDLSRAGTTAGLAGLGAVAAAYDAQQTGQRLGTAYAQDNEAGVRSEATGFAMRGAGGLLAGFTPAAVGVTGHPALAVAVADGVFLVEAFDRGAQWLNKERIVHQADTDGVKWEYTGKQWVREMQADLRDDGIDKTREQAFAALPDTARALSYKASVEAVGQAIDQANPRNPFELPANASDAPSNAPSPWKFQSESGQWTRTRYEEIDPTDPRLPDREVPEIARADRAAELNREALQIIDRNIADGPANLAAQYQIGHKRNGFDTIGEVPPVVQTALNPNTLEASDGKQYLRDAQGQWSRDGEIAQGALALELEVTRERLIPALAEYETRLANTPAWEAPTPEQQDRAMLRQAYIDKGVDPTVKPEQFEASLLAVQRTREATGVTADTASLVLGPNTNGGFSFDSSPIHHIQFDAEGKVRIAAVTSPDEIQLALNDVRTRQPGDDAPRQESSAQAIAPVTVQERESREQVLREANRDGLSLDEAQRAVQTASPRGPALSPSRGAVGETHDDRDDMRRDQEVPSKKTTEPTAATVPPDFAPGLPRGRDLRDPEHPGHDAFKEMCHRVSADEMRHGIPSGEHSQLRAASTLQMAVENGVHYQDVYFKRDAQTGQALMLNRKDPSQSENECPCFPMDLRQMSSQPIEASSQRLNEALSKHYANPDRTQTQERTQEQSMALAPLSPEGRLLFARIRGEMPGHVSDAHVGQMMTKAQSEGIRDAASVGSVVLIGDTIHLRGLGDHGKTLHTNLNEPAPPLQASVEMSNTIQKQQAQQLAQQQNNPTQDDPTPKGPRL